MDKLSVAYPHSSKKEWITHTPTWMVLKNMVLSKKRETQKSTLHVSIYLEFNKQIQWQKSEHWLLGLENEGCLQEWRTRELSRKWKYSITCFEWRFPEIDLLKLFQLLTLRNCAFYCVYIRSHKKEHSSLCYRYCSDVLNSQFRKHLLRHKTILPESK